MCLQSQRQDVLDALLVLLFAVPNAQTDYSAVIAQYIQPDCSLLSPSHLLKAVQSTCLVTANPSYTRHVISVLSCLLDTCSALFSDLLVNRALLSVLRQLFDRNKDKELTALATKVFLNLAALEVRCNEESPLAVYVDALNHMITPSLYRDLKSAIGTFPLAVLLDCVESPSQTVVEKVLELLSNHFQEYWRLAATTLKKQDLTSVQGLEESAEKCFHSSLLHFVLYGEWMKKDDLHLLTELTQLLMRLSHSQEEPPLNALFKEMSEVVRITSFQSLQLFFLQSCAEWVESRIGDGNWEVLYTQLHSVVTQSAFDAIPKEQWSKYPLSFSMRAGLNEMEVEASQTCPSPVVNDTAEPVNPQDVITDECIQRAEAFLRCLWYRRDPTSSFLSACSSFVPLLLSASHESSFYDYTLHLLTAILVYEALNDPDNRRTSELLRHALSSSHTNPTIHRMILLAFNTLRAPIVALASRFHI